METILTSKTGIDSHPIHRSLKDVPSGEYMCKEQLAFFKKILEEEKHKLLANAQQTLESMQDTAADPDPNDRASAEEKFLLEFRIRDRERKLLKKINEALARIETGAYGWCQETGEPIGLPRLLARPTATLCLEAQERRELLNRQYDQ
jgi:DnaK suppressor protein